MKKKVCRELPQKVFETLIFVKMLSQDDDVSAKMM
jgi:hypothetical protein